MFAVADLNHDGRPDLVLAQFGYNPDRSPNSAPLLNNNSAGRCTEVRAG